MCGSTTPLGKGARCAPPFHPPGHGLPLTLSHRQASQPYRRLNTRGRRRSPCTHRQRGYRRPFETHSQGLEMCLSTCTEPCTICRQIDLRSGELSRCPRYLHRPMGVPAPWDPDHFMETTSSRPSVRRLDYASLTALEPLTQFRSLRPFERSAPYEEF